MYGIACIVHARSRKCCVSAYVLPHAGVRMAGCGASPWGAAARATRLWQNSPCERDRKRVRGALPARVSA